MKVIFLDFDGPIIPEMSHIHRLGPREKAWPDCVKALNRIIEASGAKIVISSSWRWANEGEDAKDYLIQWGVIGEVIGITPILETAWKPENKLWTGVPRGREIAAWLAANAVDSFVILDDDGDMEELLDHLIQTPFEVGLTEADADRAIEMLA